MLKIELQYIEFELRQKPNVFNQHHLSTLYITSNTLIVVIMFVAIKCKKKMF